MGKRKNLYIESEHILDNPDQICGTIKILSWNVMSSKYSPTYLDNNKRVNDQVDYLHSLNVDILFLQEVDSGFHEILLKSKLFDGFNVYLTDLEPYGQITLSRFKLNTHISRTRKNGHKKILTNYNSEFQFVNCHLRAGAVNYIERSSNINKIIGQITSQSKICFICGDFNIPNHTEDVGLNVIEEYHLREWVDLVKFGENCTNEPTYDSRTNNLALESHRFDRIYCNSEPTHCKYEVLKNNDSDHYPILVIIKF